MYRTFLTMFKLGDLGNHGKGVFQSFLEQLLTPHVTCLVILDQNYYLLVFCSGPSLSSSTRRVNSVITIVLISMTLSSPKFFIVLRYSDHELHPYSHFPHPVGVSDVLFV